MTPPEKVWIGQKKAVAIVSRRLDYGETWFRNRMRPILEARGAVLVLDYAVAKTKAGRKYVRRGVRIDIDALNALIDEIQNISYDLQK
ncbi:MAG: hypothetical protein LCH53_04515 [Bacteroidetes bacterium]|nr:hypothetical protein [Bacteroidota bacterium]